MKALSFKTLLLPATLLSMCLLGACTAGANVKPDPTVVTPTVKPSVKKRTIKLALILDTSSSMDGLIEQAKSQLWSIVNELAAASCGDAKPDLKIALYQYGNDGLSAREGYIQLVTPLTEDLDQLSEDLFRLRTNGGSEFCGEAILTALKQLDWDADPDDYKVMFIAGNEPFNQGRVDYREVCAMAKNKGVFVNTIHCGDFGVGIQEFWKNGADLAGGNYMAIDHNVKTEFIASPYDDKISELNVKMNDTYIPYGEEGESKKEKMVQQDRNSASYGSANAVKRASVKSSHVYKAKSWDLAEAAQEDATVIEKVAPAALPAEMKGMNTDQKKAYVAKKLAERDQIKAEINKLNQEREKFVQEKSKTKGKQETLDNAMMKAVKDQAKSKQFKFEK